MYRSKTADNATTGGEPPVTVGNALGTIARGAIMLAVVAVFLRWLLAKGPGNA
jgi:hypothetical protein